MHTANTDAPYQDRFELARAGVLLGFAAAVQVSIAAAELLLAVLLVLWVIWLFGERRRIEAPAMFVPLIAYAVATVVSTGFSSDPRVSLMACKQLVLFLVVPAVYQLARGRRARAVLTVIIVVGAASATIGILQYALMGYDNLARRPHGVMGHYMTYSGLMMLVVCAAAAQLLFGRRRLWPALSLSLLLVALTLTFTRSAWIGTLAGLGVLLSLKDVRLLVVLPFLAAAFFALAPHGVTHRFYSIFDPVDVTNIERIAMLREGARMVAAHPLVGLGPNMVEERYAEYRAPTDPFHNNQHLHNVLVQIAAERGLPALGAWLWFVLSLALDLTKKLRRAAEPMFPAAAVAALAAMLAAGLFEYNFGDSEFLMLFLVLVTLPYAAEHALEVQTQVRSSPLVEAFQTR
ncbi:MAG TPA: O-antigen ligase family protein [Vicinamibacterales bacterium]|jgi:O-antigen ligase|nr:O-antigen ligase family protein [Vicinamibacterales bacterium]